MYFTPKNLFRVVATTTLLTLVSCSSQSLSEQKAQKLMNKFMESNGTATIVGGVIQDEGSSNAEAQIKLQNYWNKNYDRQKKIYRNGYSNLYSL